MKQNCGLNTCLSFLFFGIKICSVYLLLEILFVLYILDHTSKTFMPELETGNKYGTEKPVAAEPGLYFCTTFARL